jgi:hypothetical protein
MERLLGIGEAAKALGRVDYDATALGSQRTDFGGTYGGRAPSV